MKRISIVAVVALLSVVLVAGSAFADGYGKGRGEYKGMSDKFFCKAKMMLIYQDELGLSEKQVDKIIELKHATKKDLIKKKADIKLVKVDIKSELYEDKIDTAKLDKLIDSKYALKSEKAKYLVQAYADLKGILSEEQMEKFKKIWRDSMKK